METSGNEWPVSNLSKRVIFYLNFWLNGNASRNGKRSFRMLWFIDCLLWLNVQADIIVVERFSCFWFNTNWRQSVYAFCMRYFVLFNTNIHLRIKRSSRSYRAAVDLIVAQFNALNWILRAVRRTTRLTPTVRMLALLYFNPRLIDCWWLATNSVTCTCAGNIAEREYVLES